MKVYLGRYPKGDKPRKIRVRIDKWDTWDCAHTLSHIVLPMLKQYKETTHGYPGDLTEQLWDEILDKMIWSFDQHNRDEPDEPILDMGEYLGSTEIDRAVGEIKMVKTLSKWSKQNTQEEIDKWKVDYKAYVERLDEGFQLFGKWFRNIWD